MAPSNVTVYTTVTTTLKLFSPCSSPTCERCKHHDSPTAQKASSPIVVDSPQLSTWSMVSSTPGSPSMPTHSPLPEVPADSESSSLVTDMINTARAKVRASGFKPEPLPFPVPNPESMDFNERLDTAIAKSEALLAEARAQLAAPVVAPPELTEEEQREKERNAEWDRLAAKGNDMLDDHMKRNQALYKDVMATIDELEAAGVPLPDCSDLLTWESNAGYAGVEKKDAKKDEPAGKAKPGKASVSKGGQADQKVASVQEERNHKPVEQEVAWQNVFRWEFKVSW